MFFAAWIGCWGGEAEPLLFPIDAPCTQIGATLSEVLAHEGVWSPGESSAESRIEFVRRSGRAELTVGHTGQRDDSVRATSIVYELETDGGELRVTACRTSVACSRSVLPPCS